jgi:hypothetical protein
MEEFFINDFVVKVESGHPGYITYKIIATPESLRKLARELEAAVDRCERVEQLEGSSSSMFSAAARDRWKNGEFPLVGKPASISKGKTSRVYLSFIAARNLDAHHVHPTSLRGIWNNISCLFTCLSILGILYLALLGLAQIIHGFI